MLPTSKESDDLAELEEVLGLAFKIACALLLGGNVVVMAGRGNKGNSREPTCS